jgi:multidrug transporter EmrE-like cation transporter
VSWIYLAVAIVCEVIATSSLKASEGFTKLLPSLLVVCGYGGAFFFLSLTLKFMPIGVAYAIWSGVGVVLISLVAWLFFGQNLNMYSMIGMALIVAGVLVLKLLGQTGSE